MECLATSDVEQIVRLVSEAADPTADVVVPERKRILVEGVARLAMADIWLWTTAVFSQDGPGDTMATSFIHGGRISEEEPARWFAVLTDPKMRPASHRLYQSCRTQYVTHDREAFAREMDLADFDAAVNGAGIGHFVVSHYPVGENVSSTIGLYRRLGRPKFSDRDKAVVHVIFQQVDWLHRFGSEVPARDKVLALSRREREVLVFLLGGDTQKEVARKLELSEHTVGDYVKQIYKRFTVSSRGELLAHFISGGQR